MHIENISDLESKVQSVFTELGYSKYMQDRMCVFTRKMIDLHNEQGKQQLDTDIVKNYVSYQEKRYQNGEISRSKINQHRKSGIYLTQIYNTGSIINKRHVKISTLPECFERVLSDILKNDEWSLKHRKTQHEHSNRFFRWLYAKGLVDLSHIYEHIVREYLTACATRMSGASLDSTRRMLKQLLLFIFKSDSLPKSINKLFLLKIPMNKKIQPFMPQDEIAAVLNVIDRSTAIGNRDYAMILLAATTGLRSIDITELTLDSIDWRNGEMRIVQAKTDVTLALPLTIDVGAAVREYILNARPKSSSERVFLCTNAPFNAMSRRVIGKRLNAYCEKAELAYVWGFHSLRRSIATSMVASGVSVITVAQALGHKSINSTKQYISLDSLNLKKCALDFTGIAVGGSVI